MARRVQRRLTFKRATRGAPWLFRHIWSTGPPRTCLTHQREPFNYAVDDEHVYRIGDFDWLLRLYQHHGLSMASVRPEGHIAYFEEEWDFLRSRGCEWLEYVNTSNGTVWRNDFTTAQRYGKWELTPRGSMFLVPLHQYIEEE